MPQLPIKHKVTPYIQWEQTPLTSRLDTVTIIMESNHLNHPFKKQVDLLFYSKRDQVIKVSLIQMMKPLKESLLLTSKASNLKTRIQAYLLSRIEVYIIHRTDNHLGQRVWAINIAIAPNIKSITLGMHKKV